MFKFIIIGDTGKLFDRFRGWKILSFAAIY